MIRLFIFLALLISAGFVFAAGVQNTVEPGPIKPWIKPLNFSRSPPPSSEGGVAYVLVDRQVKIEDRRNPAWFYHNVNYIVAQTGLASASQINLEFDPSYQKIVLNQLTIHRQGVKIDKLKAAKITIIQRERELENQIYDGSLTANINLDDVRVGDFIESAYTLEGENPVFDNTYAGLFYTQWGTPVQELSVRLLWLKPNPPKAIRVFNSEKPIEHEAVPAGHEYRFHTTGIAARMVNSEAPSWFSPYSRIEVSDYANWHQVAAWATTLYQPPQNAEPVIRDLANDIRIHNATRAEQIVAALQLVQGQVRYLGIEMGISSHKPSAPADTWSRKYGDCKDKSTLFVAILRELGVPAFPALVNSDLRRSIADKLPSPHAFNHVITKVVLEDQTYWLDPTRPQQYGPLDEVYQSRFGNALVIAPESTSLEVVEPIKIAEQKILTEYFVSGDSTNPVEMHIHSEYGGGEAERVRYDLASRGLADLSDGYLNFYKRYFPGITRKQPPSFQDDKLTGKIAATEQYSIEKFWETNSAGRLVGNFSADALLGALKIPEERARNSPYALTFPSQAYQKIKVHLKPGTWNFDKEDNVVDNAFFHFKQTAIYIKEQNTLELEYIFATKADFVPDDRIDEYMEAVKKAKDLSSYSIYESIEESSNNFAEDYYYLFFYCGAIGLWLAAVGIACWLRVKDKNTNAAALAVTFYPVELWRFLILNLVTLGGYQTYHMWMNWRYVRRHDQRIIAPIARAIFYPIWMYSYIRRITTGAEIQRQQLPQAKLFALTFAFLFVLTTIFSGIEQFGLLQLLFLFINFILAAITAWQILNFEQSDLGAVNELASWKFRHYLLIGAFLPIFAFSVGDKDNLFSGQKVLVKNKISKIGSYFLRQNGVFTSGENPKLFYAVGLFDIFSEGFGATESSVFSYWHEGGELQFKKIPLASIQDIKLADEGDSEDNYAISIFDSSQNETKLLVTSEDKNHKAFYRKLVALWKASKPIMTTQ